MPHPRFSSEEIARRGQVVYEEQIRAVVDTPDNRGKVVVADIGRAETGEVSKMTVTIKAHFDGKVIVPDEPVNLPVNEPLEVALKAVGNGTPGKSAWAEERMYIARLIQKGPVPGGRTWKREDLHE